MPVWAAWVVAGLLGLVIGSFLNVVVWRVPRGQSVVSPPSACPRCGHRLGALENVPVVSWLVLRGRCHSCREPISVRYPLVELGTAAVFVLVVVRFGSAQPWAIPAFAYLGAVSVALALIDLDVRRLPDAIVLPSYPVGAALLVLASLAGGEGTGGLVRAAIGGAGLYGLYFALVLAKPGGMGFGDVKLAGVLGGHLAWVGWGSLAVGAFSAFLLGGIYAVLLLVSRRATRRSGIPFGPWMLAGAAVGVAWGEQLWSGYLGLMAT